MTNYGQLDGIVLPISFKKVYQGRPTATSDNVFAMGMSSLDLPEILTCCGVRDD